MLQQAGRECHPRVWGQQGAVPGAPGETPPVSQTARLVSSARETSMIALDPLPRCKPFSPSFSLYLPYLRAALVTTSHLQVSPTGPLATGGRDLRFLFSG